MKSFKASKTIWGTFAVLLTIIGVQTWVIFAKENDTASIDEKVSTIVENRSTEPDTTQTPQGPEDFWGQDDFFDVDPFKEMERMHDRMRKMMDLAMADIDGEASFANAEHFKTTQPEISLEDKGDHYQIQISVPGVDEPQVQTELSGNQLTISCILDESHEKSDEGKGFHSRSVMKQQYTQVLSFQEPIDPETLESHLKDKVLVLTLKKSS